MRPYKHQKRDSGKRYVFEVAGKYIFMEPQVKCVPSKRREKEERLSWNKEQRTVVVTTRRVVVRRDSYYYNGIYVWVLCDKLTHIILFHL